MRRPGHRHHKERGPSAQPVARRRDRIVDFLSLERNVVAVAGTMFLTSVTGLLAANVVGGLREVGEPARNALIVDLAPAHLKGRSIGLYYVVRSVAIDPAGLVGGLLWGIDPIIPFLGAGLLGFLGTLVFAWTVSSNDAGSK